MLASCASQKRMSLLSTGPWQEVNTTATVEGEWQGKKLSSPVTMHAVRDSVVEVSVRPFLGIEAAKMIATPEGWVIRVVTESADHHGDYQRATELLGELVTWRRLQEFASGENKFTKVKVTYKKIVKK